ncbi:MAG: flavodoxin family protein [Candidatus Thorarchaeota archaeon]|nr:flavodoxin family protein [Candidatus Thorarchaeota archaeon]
MKIMHALILDGFKGEDARRDPVRSALTAELESRGATWKWIEVERLQIAPCRGCFHCWTKTPGICVIDDDAIGVARMIAQCDVMVYVTPVVFGGVSPTLKAAMDRNICLVQPFFERVNGEVHHKRRYKRYPSMVAIGIADTDDTEGRTLFERLMTRMSINNRSVAYAGVALPEESLYAKSESKGAPSLRSVLGSLLTRVEVVGR